MVARPLQLTSFVAGMVSAERWLLSMTLLVYQGSHDRMYCCKIEKATTIMVWKIKREGRVSGQFTSLGRDWKEQRGVARTCPMTERRMVGETRLVSGRPVRACVCA